MSFVLLSALFPKAKYEARLENPSKEQLALHLQSFLHVISANVYSFSPIDYDKVVAFAPKNVKNLKDTLSSFTPSKLSTMLKPTIKLKLQEPSEESEVKKYNQKLKALDTLALSAFMHCIFTQVYPLSFKALGNPSKKEVRVASNLPEWQIVKKIDMTKAEDKDVFASLVGMYNSLHLKYVDFSPTPLQVVESGRKSYSTLLTNLENTSSGKDFASEWTTFEAFRSSGFPPIPDNEVIGQVFPELKIPKPRGNFGKKKK